MSLLKSLSPSTKIFCSPVNTSVTLPPMLVQGKTAPANSVVTKEIDGVSGRVSGLPRSPLACTPRSARLLFSTRWLTPVPPSLHRPHSRSDLFNSTSGQWITGCKSHTYCTHNLSCSASTILSAAKSAERDFNVDGQCQLQHSPLIGVLTILSTSAYPIPVYSSQVLRCR